MTQRVLILGGSGKIGSHASKVFKDAGWDVRHFNRKTDDMTKMAKGCDVIINGLNPANYANWAHNIPAITNQVIAAAKATGATVIIPGNIYNFGNQPGELTETTPHRPHTRKGRIRVEMEQAYRASGVRTIILRAGNFIDPAHNGDVMSLFILRGIRSGKITHGGTPKARNAYAYLPDWAKAALMLAEKREQLALFEDIAFPGHHFTWHDLKKHLEKVTDRNLRLVGFPWWLMSVLSPFLELARELSEMRYLYEMDHWMGAEKFERLLPEFTRTQLSRVMEAGLPGDLQSTHPNPDKRASAKLHTKAEGIL